MQTKHYLIIDDNAQQLEKLSGCLKEIGLRHIRKAVGADNAWMAMKQQTVDCVICAYEMSEMTGLALLKIIRKEDKLSNIPFFLTDSAFTKLKVLKAGQIGVTGLFVIPYKRDVMKAKIQKAFTQSVHPVLEQTQEAFDKGLKLIEEKQYAEALEIFTAITDPKNNPEYYFNIGYIKTSQGKHSEAIEAFSMATKLDSLFAKAYEEMGRVYRLMGDHENAEKYMHLAAEIYMDTNRIGSAEDVLNEILEAGTQSLNVFNTLGVVYRKKGDPGQALKHYQKALRVHPDEPYIFYNMGRLYLDMKKMEDAKSSFETALEKDPSFEAAKQVIKAIDLGLV